MPPRKNTAKITVQKSPKPVPEWAQKVKAYREAAGKTQVEIRNAINGKVNTLSLVERGIQEFTANQRKLFFEFIGKPEDPSIPCKTRGGKPKAARKAAKSARTEPKPGKEAKAVKAAKADVVPQPAKTAKAPKATKTPKAAKAPRAEGARKALKREKPFVAPAPTPVPKASEPAAAAPKAPRKTRTPKPVRAVPTPSARAESVPMKVAEPASRASISPVKEAVVRDISRILSNPGLSDHHAQRLHSLFTSLAVNALLSE